MVVSTSTLPKHSPRLTRGSRGRVLLAKVGLDGHDRGIKVVARGLRDSGFHVIYGGIWQSPEAVAQAALDEDVDWIGLSLLSGAHMTLVPRVIHAIQRSGNQRARCLVGGIIPESDLSSLRDLGIEAVFGPGTPIRAISEFLQQAGTIPESASTGMLIRETRRGSRAALSRLLSSISRGEVASHEIVVGDRPSIDRIAITGGGGVGKSSLVAHVSRRLEAHGKKVAVLACDPQSPLTGGALLGDRVRMAFGSTSDPNLFLRSLAVESDRQGIARGIDLMIGALQLHGFDVVIVESAGVGQGDVAVRQFVDHIVLLLQPETGDGVQWEKAGLLEIADMIAINKSDLPGADRMVAELNQHLRIPGHRDVPILRTSTSRGDGIEELCLHFTR